MKSKIWWQCSPGYHIIQLDQNVHVDDARRHATMPVNIYVHSVNKALCYGVVFGGSEKSAHHVAARFVATTFGLSVFSYFNNYVGMQ